MTGALPHLIMRPLQSSSISFLWLSFMFQDMYRRPCLVGRHTFFWNAQISCVPPLTSRICGFSRMTSCISTLLIQGDGRGISFGVLTCRHHSKGNDRRLYFFHACGKRCLCSFVAADALPCGFFLQHLLLVLKTRDFMLSCAVTWARSSRK